MKSLIMLALGLLLAGCGYVDKFQARQEYKAAVDDYRRCLRTAPRPSACERERQLMVVNKQAFGAMAAGVTPGGMGYYQIGEDD